MRSCGRTAASGSIARSRPPSIMPRTARRSRRASRSTGRSLPTGSRSTPALAAVLRAIASGGPKAFYEGAPADDIVATLAPRGSFLTREDFARHRGELATPIATNYRGLNVVEMPPNGQGLAALVLLNIL